MSFESRQLRNILGHFATGVAVVTAVDDNGERAGITINSFSSVSLEPPLVLFSLGHGSRSLPLFRRSRDYVVNVLAAGQVATSASFSRYSDDKWSQNTVRAEFNGAPIIEGSLAYLGCRREQVMELGDHAVFLCRAIEFNSDTGKGPLIFYAGRYRALNNTAV